MAQGFPRSSPHPPTEPVQLCLSVRWGWEHSGSQRQCSGAAPSYELQGSGHLGSGKWVNPLHSRVLPASCCCCLAPRHRWGRAGGHAQPAVCLALHAIRVAKHPATRPARPHPLKPLSTSSAPHTALQQQEDRKGDLELGHGVQTCPPFKQEGSMLSLIPGGFHPSCAQKTSPFPASPPRCHPHQTLLGSTQEPYYLRAAPEATLLVMSEVVFRRLLLSSSWLRGTELARVDTSSRSWWSSLRLRRRRLLCCSLLERHSLLIRLCDTTSSKRCRCFLGMKILEKGQGEQRVRMGLRGARHRVLHPAVPGKGRTPVPCVPSASALPVSTRNTGCQGYRDMGTSWMLAAFPALSHAQLHRLRRSEPSAAQCYAETNRNSSIPP